MDFALKIMHLSNGKKVRVQLWDMAGGGYDTASVFSPLFIRNAVGCLIVSNADYQSDKE